MRLFSDSSITISSNPKNQRAWEQRFDQFFGSRQSSSDNLSVGLLMSELRPKLNSEKDLFKILCFLFNAYPSQEQLDKYFHLWTLSGYDYFFKIILSDLAFKSAWRESRPRSWTFFRKDSILVDVTDTFAYPYRTGIQRVVYELCGNLFRNRENIYLISRHDFRPTELRLLSKKEIDSFLFVNPSIVSAKKGWALFPFIASLVRSFSRAALSSFKHFLFFFYHETRKHLIETRQQNQFCELVLSWLDENKHKIKHLLKRKDKPRVRDNQDLIGLWGCRLILPEIIKDQQAVTFYRLLRRNTDVRIKMIVYDLGPFTFPEFSAIGEDFTYYLTLLRVADHVSCISESVRADVKRYMGLLIREVEEPITLSANLLGADFSQIGTSNEAPCPRLRSLVGSAFALVIGTFEPRKNQTNILKGYQLFLRNHPDSNLHLVFAGNPGWKNETFLSQLDLEIKREHRIHKMMTLSDTELVWLYQNSLFSIFCSHFEGFGLPIVESLHWNKPVITSNRGSMAEIANKFGGCLLVDPNRPSEISAAIEILTYDGVALSELKGKISLENINPWDVYAKALAAF